MFSFVVQSKKGFPDCCPYGPVWTLVGPPLGPCWASPRTLVGSPLGTCWASPRALVGPPLGPCWACPRALMDAYGPSPKFNEQSGQPLMTFF